MIFDGSEVLRLEFNDGTWGHTQGPDTPSETHNKNQWTVSLGPKCETKPRVKIKMQVDFQQGSRAMSRYFQVYRTARPLTLKPLWTVCGWDEGTSNNSNHQWTIGTGSRFWFPRNHEILDFGGVPKCKHKFILNLRWFMLWIQRFYPFLHPIFWGIPTLQFFANPQKIPWKICWDVQLVQSWSFKNPTTTSTTNSLQPLGSPQPLQTQGTQIGPRGYVRFVFEQIFGLNPEGRLGIEASLINIEWCEFFVLQILMDFLNDFFHEVEMIHKNKLWSCWFLIGCN